MPPMMQLPAYSTGNALLDFTPVNNGLDRYRKGMEDNRNYLTAQDVGREMEAKNYGNALAKSIANDRADLAGVAMQAQAHASQQEDASFNRTMRMAQVHGAMADRVLKGNDPTQQQAAWQQMLGSHPEYASNLQKFGVDPRDYKNGLAFVRDQAASHLAELELKKAQVASIPVDAALKRAQLENLTLPHFEATGVDRFGQPIRGFVDRRTQTVSPPTNAPSGGQAQSNLPPGVGVPTGEKYLEGLDQQTAAQVRALADGRVAFPNGMALKAPYWQRMVEHVSQYDPTFDAINFNARNKVRADFTSGKSAQNITSFNTAIGHLDALEKSIEGLRNTDYPMVNKARQLLGEQTGNKELQNSMAKFNTARNAVVEELTRAFKGTGGSLTEVQQWEHLIDAAKSPAALREVVKQGVELLKSRIDSMTETYRRGMGKADVNVPGLTPKALEALDRLEHLGSDKLQGKAPQPQQPTSASPNPQARPRAHNPKTGELIEFDGKEWVPVH